METNVKLRLGKNDFWFYGPGVSELLDKIEEYGSVASASLNMGLSYSKAWKIIRDSENGLGCTLVERSIGGKGGGKASLTEEGKRFNDFFKTLEKDVKVYASKRLNELLEESDWKDLGGTRER